MSERPVSETDSDTPNDRQRELAARRNRIHGRLHSERRVGLCTKHAGRANKNNEQYEKANVHQSVRG